MSKRHACDLEFDGIDHSDYPKFCDAYICAANWSDTGEALTEAELEELNNDGELVHEAVYNYIY